MAERNLKQLLQKLFTTHHLLTATDCRVQLEAAGRRFNKTSVYRALEQLVAEERLCKLNLKNDEAAYELRESHHAHLVCEQCGEISSAACSYDQPTTVNGFEVSHHHVTLMGLCATCSKKV